MHAVCRSYWCAAAAVPDVNSYCCVGAAVPEMLACQQGAEAPDFYQIAETKSHILGCQASPRPFQAGSSSCCVRRNALWLQPAVCCHRQLVAVVCQQLTGMHE